MRRVALTLALGLLAAPAASLAAQQAPKHAQPAQRGRMMDPIAQLLEHRADLQLSADQVNRLQAIEQKLEQERAPLEQQMKQLRAERAARSGPPSDEERAAMRQRMQQMRPAMQEYRKQLRAGLKEARSVLTPEQQAKAKRYLRAQSRGDRDGRAGQDGGRRSGSH